MTQYVEDFSTSEYWHQESFDFLASQFMPFVIKQEVLEKSPAFQKFIASKTLLQQTPTFQKAMADEMTIQQAPAFKELQSKEERRTLLRLLKRRFEAIPESLVAQIEATTDHALLEAWQDSLLDITDLAEFERLMHRSQAGEE